MLFVCRSHVKEGIKMLHTPHVKSVKDDGHKCSFVSCPVQAEYKLFSPFSLSIKRIWQHVRDEKIV